MVSRLHLFIQQTFIRRLFYFSIIRRRTGIRDKTVLISKRLQVSGKVSRESQVVWVRARREAGARRALLDGWRIYRRWLGTQWEAQRVSKGDSEV